MTGFFPFREIVSCLDVQEVGRSPRTPKGSFDDLSKFVCGINSFRFQNGHCIVYSIGGNNQWAFEKDLLKKTSCEVHTFDCTGPRSRFKKPNSDRLFFHHICMENKYKPASNDCRGRHKCGKSMTLAEIQAELGHDTVDILKIDIEGFEVPIIQSWWRNKQNKNFNLPRQLLMELHYSTFPHFSRELKESYLKNFSSDCFFSDKNRVFQTATDMVTLQMMLLEMGYVVSVYDGDTKCPHCVELSLVRLPLNLY
uniref:Methyltransferase domain-containing protein n=1 Tax=Cyclophora tenuis TaxID=216820 RepID=A0A7S1CW03_CYCTE|mmetsp:Transcript_11659/g.19761  ORF Transcript_11659/g.19761 Transcript_11659/m.19761 type:complete len:253 (+) Transcript_11659:324-1082(+)